MSIPALRHPVGKYNLRTGRAACILAHSLPGQLKLSSKNPTAINSRNMIGYRNRKLKLTYHNQSPLTSYNIHPLSHKINATKFGTIGVHNRSAPFLAGRAAPCIDALPVSFPDTLNNGSSHNINSPLYCILEFYFPHGPPLRIRCFILY